MGCGCHLMSLHCMLIKFTILYVLILLDLNSWTGLTATVKGCGGHLLTSLHWVLNCSVLITSFSGLSFCPLYILRRLNQVNLHIKSILKSRYDIFSHKRRYFIQFSFKNFMFHEIFKSFNHPLLWISNHYFLLAWWHSHWFALGFEILPLPRIPCGAASVLNVSSRGTAWNKLHKFCCKSVPQKWNQFYRSASLSHPHSR